MSHLSNLGGVHFFTRVLPILNYSSSSKYASFTTGHLLGKSWIPETEHMGKGLEMVR